MPFLISFMFTQQPLGVHRHDGYWYRSSRGQFVRHECKLLSNVCIFSSNLRTQLLSHLESSPYAFFVMSGLSSAIAFLVTWVGLRRHVILSHATPSAMECLFLYPRLAKIRKIGLSNTSGNRKTKSPWLPLPLRRREAGGWL